MQHDLGTFPRARFPTQAAQGFGVIWSGGRRTTVLTRGQLGCCGHGSRTTTEMAPLFFTRGVPPETKQGARFVVSRCSGSQVFELGLKERQVVVLLYPAALSVFELTLNG